MNWKIDTASSQEGRVAIVTGSNVGTGYETALFLAKKGCEVILACRNAANAEAARARMLSTAPNARVTYQLLDLASLASVRRFAQEFMSTHSRLDLLINNAGVMVPPYSLTEDGLENQFASNYAGHFVLTGLLLPQLESTPKSRIVSVSSVAHRNGDIHFEDINFKRRYKAGQAYSQSKLACLMFAYEAQRRLAAAGYQTISVAAHPGVSNTNLARHVPRLARPLLAMLSSSPEQGAGPIIFAALNPSLKGGEYVGPRGFGEWRGEPGLVDSTPRSKDVALAARLWSTTEQLTGFKYLSPADGTDTDRVAAA